MAQTLLDISEDLMALDALLQEATSEDGEINPEVAASLDAWFAALMSDRDRKMDNYGALIRTMELRAAARQEEHDRLAKRVRVDENQAKYLKKRLREFMDLHNMPKVETRRYKFSCCGNGGVQPMDMPDEAEKLPKEYQIPIVKHDTEKVRKDLLAGKVIEGCKLLPRGRHLRIS